MFYLKKMIFKSIIPIKSYYVNRHAKMTIRRCEICNVDVYRASYNKHLRSKKHTENIKHNEMIIPEWLFREPIENKIEKIYNPISLKKLARNKINLDDKQLNKELAKKMINPYYFSDRNLKDAYKINLDSHHINHLISKLTITSNFETTGIDSVWRFDKIISMTIYFYKTNEMIGSNYVKIPLRSNAILNIENNDKYCFLWSILAYLHPCNNNHPNRVTNYRQYFNEILILVEDSDVVKFINLMI